MTANAGYHLFNTGDVLTAAQVQYNLQNQTIMYFASSAARTSALSGVLVEGMFSYLADTNSTEYYDGAAWQSISNPGDITGVTAGTGISGGGTSGTVTVTNSMATEITAAGDIIVGTGSGTFDNLPIGTTAQVLTADTSVSPYKVKWAAAGGSSGPAFSAYASGTGQTISAATWTKIRYNSETFDTANNFDSTTNYRFTPTTSGYYQMNATNEIESATLGNAYQISLYKNGSPYSKFGQSTITNQSSGGINGAVVMNFNGSTDYAEMYIYAFTTGGTMTNNASTVNFNGVWIRS